MERFLQKALVLPTEYTGTLFMWFNFAFCVYY